MPQNERSYRTRAYVLRGRPYGEADRILVLFTHERGKLDAIAKGASRPKSALAGRLEFGCELDLALHRGRNLDVVTGADMVRERWDGLVRPEAFATAQLFAELIDLFCEPDFQLADVYALVDAAMRAAATSPAPSALVPRFEARLLALLGLAPHAETCVHCSGAFADAAFADFDGGGLACAACRPQGSDSFAFSVADVANLRGLLAPSGNGACAAARPAVARALDAFVSHHLGRRPKSLRLVEELRAPAS